ncbi:hypothetical protein ABZ371_11385 [Streptomyces sp. NPDC005899]|uniref:alpha/beta fold hydrolase n=1 Tax=Streptomyces sp. NPDC005899 TaxID=3155716 RepID=UPI0033D4F431
MCRRRGREEACLDPPRPPRGQRPAHTSPHRPARPPGTPEHLDLLIDQVDLREDLAAITVPTSVISTTLDQLFTPYHHRQLADTIPGAEYAELSTGHLPFVERPEEWCAILLDFLGNASA